jgi:transcriptional regulator GlxA family with amidase domain
LISNLTVVYPRYFPNYDSYMPIPDKTSETPTQTLAVLLVEGFALMSYASIIEPYRAANALAERQLYRWLHVSIDGRPVRASNGTVIAPDQGLKEKLVCDTLFVIAGGNPAGFSDAKTLTWLRRQAARNITLAGVSGGPFILAKAGLLNDHRMTIHWDHWPAFVEAFPLLQVESSLYVIDRKRVTCAGGIAGLDLTVELIEREQGHALASQVSEWLIGAKPRAAEAPQRQSLRDRYGINDDRLLRVLAEMEVAVEDTRSRDALARVAGLSVRQLERLFVNLLGRTLHQTYLDIRLKQSDQLLLKTGLSITAIALSCGFRSSSHFSRVYHEAFHQAPRTRRATVSLQSAAPHLVDHDPSQAIQNRAFEDE